MPSAIQKELLIEVADCYFSTNRLLDAARILAYLGYLFPELAFKHGLIAADLVIRAEKENAPLVPVNIYRRFFSKTFLMFICTSFSKAPF
ncbi:hypothetical protein K493DRAFT_36405 [Basidiobolus meristosporus CBS 931.73]|uniref:Uncharacterized protein n=1 Tax=Basidiobolus meristosporus CBS 931.73 TaxID=1314790 RepID=A0A1Y1Y5X3_9FUNG|nr:hypothetical protein K493DRAFT_36405 [Basidiobolus meristosporus CBS 931.73]|eukprot:ORX93430.1 hypothetical protein K493DRAFT_36405 [Basidiobolus meristosporus CBS 931.73]